MNAPEIVKIHQGDVLDADQPIGMPYIRADIAGDWRAWRDQRDAVLEALKAVVRRVHELDRADTIGNPLDEEIRNAEHVIYKVEGSK